jgi:hypothetical protein
MALVNKQDRKCALTGEDLTPNTAALDHRVAVVNGGTHDIYNVQVVHQVVNRMKHTLGNEEFVEWCRKVVTWADQDQAVTTESQNQSYSFKGHSAPLVTLT